MADSNSKPEDQAPAPSMTIVPACIPPLKSGTYTIEVKQQIENKDHSGKTIPPFTAQQVFHVSAPRFSLDPATIYSVYPPAASRGNYSDCLPHVVLNRRTLPWERSPATTGQNGDTPWLALLLLDADELHTPKGQEPLQPQSRKLAELETTGLKRDPWEKLDDPCLILDIPLKLFRRIAPSWEDLRFLAHARCVRTDHMASDGIDDKSNGGGDEEQAWFSVIIGNRLPTPDKENTVYLISLEGLQDYLPKVSASNDVEDSGDIRLVVLASWSFENVTGAGTFYDLAIAVGDKSGPLRIQSDSHPELDKTLKTALDSGYVPLNHVMRHGFKTLSWYRGPLVPLFLPTEPINVVYSCADAALRYDLTTGLFDISYAAAWQLGRLLALQNQHFIRALSQFTFRRVQGASESVVRNWLAERLGIQSEQATAEQLVLEFLQTLDPDKPEAAGTASAIKDTFNALQDKCREPVPNIPDEIKQWLGRLYLLHGVPFDYLVPRADMLPQESIRFFYVDSSWVEALLDGALSVSRSSESRLSLDQAMAGNFLQSVLDELQLDEDLDYNLPSTDGTRDLKVIGHITGFILRSSLVSGWRGLKIRAYDGKEQTLTALRVERITSDLLLCIYNGKIERVDIIQPPHGLHFGGPDVKAKGGEHRRVAVHALAHKWDLEGNRAEFAKKMIDQPVRFTIKVRYESQ